MSSEPGFGAMLLFLDYDGPLHPSDVHFDGTRCYFRSVVGHSLFEHAPLLEQMLEPYPDVRIVLSTRWVYLFGPDRTAAFLPPGLRRRVIGTTSDSACSPHWDSFARAKQIKDDVDARQPADWIAVDDDGAGWPKQLRKRLVLCDPVEGLANAETQKRLVFVLKRMDMGRRRRSRLVMRRVDMPR